MTNTLKTIAVFCALPPGRNPGMATVDLAALSLLTRIAPDAAITLYAYGKPTPFTYHPGALPYEYLNVEEHGARYLSSDVFVFWGDFTHARSYWTVDRGYSPAMHENMSQAAIATWNAEQFERVSTYVFLTSLPRTRLKDVVVFGSTLITNDATDEIDRDDDAMAATYYAHFTNFFTNVRAVYFRDALSAARISPFRGDEASLGCDCAFLLQDDDLYQIRAFARASVREGVGVFFGRSPSKTKMMLFARVVARLLGERASWLPWFFWYPTERSYRIKAWALGFHLSPSEAPIGAVLSAISGYKYIITDTYHLCVNAWRMGIPAICIGEGTSDVLSSLNDKKKEHLYDMYGARHFYVFL